MTIDEFADKYLGKKVCNGGLCQCVALARQYIDDVLGFPQFPTVKGAYQIYDVIDSKYFEKVDEPQKGDLVIWDKNYGGSGHVAIYWQKKDDKFISFDQNHLGTGQLPQLVVHNYGENLKGFLRPKKESEDNMCKIDDEKAKHMRRHLVHLCRSMILGRNVSPTEKEIQDDESWIDRDSGDSYNYKGMAEYIVNLYNSEEAKKHRESLVSDCSKYTKGINEIKTIVNNI